MSYRVVKAFTDLQDNNYAYKEGDTYPRKGLEVLPSRAKELSTTANKRHEVLIVKEEKKPTKKGE